MDGLRDLADRLTILAVTHRTSMIRPGDQIVHLDAAALLGELFQYIGWRMKDRAAAWGVLAIGLLFAAGSGWLLSARRDDCTGARAKEGLKTHLGQEARRNVIYIGFSDVDSELSLSSSQLCSAGLEVSFGRGDGIKILGSYEVTPFGVNLLGHEHLSSRGSADLALSAHRETDPSIEHRGDLR